MSNEIFAIHQPNFFPYIGYFSKILQSDIFVFLDVVQIPRGKSFASRNRIKTPNGEFFLIAPLRKSSGQEGKLTYREASFADGNWREKHLKTLRANYTKAPFFEEIFGHLQKLYDANLDFLDFNLKGIRWALENLGIETRLVLLSDLVKEPNLKNDLIIQIGEALSAKTYLCGKGGGLEYTDPKYLHDTAGISVEYTSYSAPTYPQLWKSFVPNLSILDPLFNLGFEGTLKLLEQSLDRDAC